MNRPYGVAPYLSTALNDHALASRFAGPSSAVTLTVCLPAESRLVSRESLSVARL